jgi:DNA-binding beta-propeller fold protein YncE
MHTHFPGLSRSMALTAVALGLAGGCATPPPPDTVSPVFFPPPPAEPRVQFLTSFSREEDLGRRRNRLLTFLVGNPPPSVPVAKPYGATLHQDKLYVCDTVPGALVVFDLEERRLTRWARGDEGRLQVPIHVAFGPEGTLYVADAQRGQVVMFDPLGSYLGCLGAAGEMKPTDVAVAGHRVYVADVKNHRVAVYDRASRQRLFTLPRPPAKEEARLFSPTNLALDAAGHLYVSDSGAFRVQKYAPDGTFLKSFGTHGDAPGQFAMPKGIAVDRDGRIHVVDAAMQAVQVFDADGRLLMFFGEPGGSDRALNLPAAVSIDYLHVDRFQAFADPGFALDYLLLVTSQYGARKVNVFGFGHPR